MENPGWVQCQGRHPFHRNSLHSALGSFHNRNMNLKLETKK